MTDREKELLEFIYARFCGIENNPKVDYMVAFKSYIEKHSSDRLQEYENLYVEAKTKLDKQEMIYLNLHKEIDRLYCENVDLGAKLNDYYIANTIGDVDGLGTLTSKTRGDLLEEIVGLRSNLADCEKNYDIVNNALIEYGKGLLK